MFDAIAAFLEIFPADGVPSPLTLHKQRQARLAVGAVALASSTAVLLRFDTPSVWTWSIAVTSAIAAGWVFLFSAVDVVKELPFHCMAQHRGSDGGFRLPDRERLVGLLNCCGHA